MGKNEHRRIKLWIINQILKPPQLDFFGGFIFKKPIAGSFFNSGQKNFNRLKKSKKQGKLKQYLKTNMKIKDLLKGQRLFINEYYLNLKDSLNYDEKKK